MTSTPRELLVDPQITEGRKLADRSNADLLAALEQAPDVARELLGASDEERADALLVYRSVGAIMVEALRRRVDHVFSRGVVSLSELWELGGSDAMLSLVTPDAEASLWENLVFQLYAVGALAGHWGQWAQAREISSRVSPSSGEGWLRQGQVASARTAGPTDSLPELVVRCISELAPELNEGAAKVAFVNFDLFSALVVTEIGMKYGFYPNATVFEAGLVEPFVIEQLRDAASDTRAAVFPGDDDGLRDALRDYDQQARTQAAYARFAGKKWDWIAFADARTWCFIDSGERLEDLQV